MILDIFHLYFFVLWDAAWWPLVEAGAALTSAQLNASEEANRLCDELELNDYLTVILARVGMLEYKVRHERPGASSLTQHTSKSRQANDTKLSSDPQGVKNGSEWLTVLLKSLRLPTRAVLPPLLSPFCLSFSAFVISSFVWLTPDFFFFPLLVTAGWEVKAVKG